MSEAWDLSQLRLIVCVSSSLGNCRQDSLQVQEKIDIAESNIRPIGWMDKHVPEDVMEADVYVLCATPYVSELPSLTATWRTISGTTCGLWRFHDLAVSEIKDDFSSAIKMFMQAIGKWKLAQTIIIHGIYPACIFDFVMHHQPSLDYAENLLRGWSFLIKYLEKCIHSYEYNVRSVDVCIPIYKFFNIMCNFYEVIEHSATNIFLYMKRGSQWLVQRLIPVTVL